MSARATNGVVQVGGLKLRGTLTGITYGNVKRTVMVNGDGTTDYSEELVPAEIAFEISMISDVEMAQIQAVIEQPLLATFPNGQKYSMAKATYTDSSDLTKEGAWPVKFGGLIKQPRAA